MIERRSFLAGMGSAAALATVGAPAFAQSARAKTLVIAGTSGILILDPSFTTITPTNTYGIYVYDMLYAVDSKNRASPQMAEGHTVSADNLTWNIKLRSGLKFHDGERVLARDCVASIKRWGYRDGFGASLLAATNELIAVDDNTIRFRLKKPFGVLPDALAHPTASPCCIMPERVASGDITKAITETIGSGPLKFVASGFVPGQSAVFEKNAAYVPRGEAPDGMSGGKVMYFDRVEYRNLPDQATAAAALQAGEVDWWEVANFDLLPMLKRNSKIKVVVNDPNYKNFLRFNCGTEPFNNPALRRAIAAAVQMDEFTQALVGSGPEAPKSCFAMYPCGFPGVEELGKGQMGGKKDFKSLAENVKKAGYKGEKVVLLSASDVTTTAPMAPVLMDMFGKLGINAELQSVDLNTFVGRRRSTEPVSKGGWSMFPFQGSGAVMASPLTAIVARGLGANGYPGNNTDPVLESNIDEWVAATTEQAQKAALNKVHQRLWDTMPIVPLASYGLSTAYRSDLTGYLTNSLPVAWNIRRV